MTNRTTVEISITHDADAATARRAGEELAARAGLSRVQTQCVLISISELANCANASLSPSQWPCPAIWAP